MDDDELQESTMILLYLFMNCRLIIIALLQFAGKFFVSAGIWKDKKNLRIYIDDLFDGRVVLLQYLEGPS